LGKKSREKKGRQPVPAPPPVPDIPAPPGGPWRWRAAIFVVAFVAFLPVLTADFVNLDDEPNFLKNVQYRGFTFGNVSWMLSTYHKGHYQPLSWLTLAFDYTLWGMDARGYHLTNLTIHAANAVLLYGLLVVLLSRAVGATDALRLHAAAAAGAVLWAVHPLRVEAVAWITERRDVLATLFALLACRLWLRWTSPEERHKKPLVYVAALVLFTLSLASKAWAITLPVIWLALDAFPLRRWTRWEDWKTFGYEKIPFFAASAIFALIASAAQKQAGAWKDWVTHDVLDRTMQAAYGLCFYVWKSLAPVDLLVMYELHDDMHPLAPVHLLSLASVLAVTALLFWQRRRWPWLLATWFCYAVLVSPVLGFTQSGPQKVKDSYSYLSGIPFAALLAAAVHRYWGPRRAALQLAAVLALVLGVLSFRQSRLWDNSISLWTHTAAVTPDGHFAQNNLGAAYEDLGEPEDPAYTTQEKRDFDRIFKRRRDQIAALAARYGGDEPALARAKREQQQEAVKHFRRAADLTLDNWRPRHSLAVTLVKLGDYPAAIREWQTLIEHRPDVPESYFSIGLSLTRTGRGAESIEYYNRAIETAPNYVEAHKALAEALRLLGRKAEADDVRRRMALIRVPYVRPG
jgi:tetratricopeptide (TPR) repeat protein